ncbi:MAG: hypothetical protein RIT04_305 [Candidatus Parcubacteria bacterium]|jgi:cell division protein FtsI/penicillin-binding protein 2
MKSLATTRIRILLGIVAAVAGVLILKLYSVQIVHGDEYAKKADMQYVKPNTVLFDRGSIFFQTKDGTEVGAATVKDGFTLAVIPTEIKDASTASAAYDLVSKIVTVNRTNFIEKATKKNDPYEEIQKRIPNTEGLAIAALNIPGVRVYKDTWRIYPANTTAAQTIGLVGFQGNTVAGRYGLESFYEKILGRTAASSQVNFFAELFTDIRKTVFTDQPVEGDVITSIEPSVQNYLEKMLIATEAKWQSDSLGAIVINPNTGAIYAMGALPSFNPNDVSKVKNPAVFSNPLVENNYEMGSIIKPLTMAAGIDSGAVRAETTYNDKGFIELNSKRINNWDGKAHGITSMQDILSQSLNVGSAFIASKMGNETLRTYFMHFGIGTTTGIDQPNEQKGIISNLKSTRDVEYATAAFGQGIAMTPIATVRALSILANGGKLLRPHIASRIDYAVGTSKVVDGGEPVQVLKTETTDEVTRMLVNVVDKVMKHGEAKMEHYSIAAKTGTAQIANPAGGGYYKDRYLHSFFGYFPAYKPQFLVFMYHVYPKGAQYASETLTDPFLDMAKFLINYYQIPPDR